MFVAIHQGGGHMAPNMFTRVTISNFSFMWRSLWRSELRQRSAVGCIPVITQFCTTGGPLVDANSLRFCAPG